MFKGIREFQGLAGYYRRFVKGFFKIAAPLTRLTKKDVKSEWGEACERSFTQLKQWLTTTLLLTLLNETGEYTIHNDASYQGLRCLLTQHRWVIAYGSRQLKTHERNYPTHDLELTVIIYALKLQRHYLYGETFKIYTDNKSLKYIFTHNDLNIHQKQWIKLLKNYDCKILYHPGKGNVETDAVGRM